MLWLDTVDAVTAVDALTAVGAVAMDVVIRCCDWMLWLWML